MLLVTVFCPCSYFEERWGTQGFYSEVLFENEFVTHLPWQAVDVPRNVQEQEIACLCHITHRDGVQAITAQAAQLEELIFLGNPKMGKCGYQFSDGSPLGESYRCNLNGLVPGKNTPYTVVGPGQHLLPPGHYSWWSVEPVEDSLYGPHKFSVDFERILEAFQNSHTKRDQVPLLKFRRAGTLRYRKEICYVILVHASTDDDQHVCHLPLITNKEQKFDFGDTFNDKGEFLLGAGPHYPKFRKEINDKRHHWENVAFAFYCSNPLRIPQNDVKQSVVEHNKCMKKRMTPDGPKCPDKIP